MKVTKAEHIDDLIKSETRIISPPFTLIHFNIFAREIVLMKIVVVIVGEMLNQNNSSLRHQGRGIHDTGVGQAERSDRSIPDLV